MFGRIAPAAGHRRSSHPPDPSPAKPPMSENTEFGEASCRAIRSSSPSGHLLRALQSLERSLEADPDSYAAWIGLSSLFLRMRDADRGEQCLAVARRLRSRRASPKSGAGSETAIA